MFIFLEVCMLFDVGFFCGEGDVEGDGGGVWFMDGGFIFFDFVDELGEVYVDLLVFF